MSSDPSRIAEFFKGTFLADPLAIREKLFNTKAFVFDWDGVFNNGYKDDNGSSPFSEVDAMGTNMLRYSHFLRTNKLPITAIISGEKNNAAFTFAKREHFDAVYYKMPDKQMALDHFCRNFLIDPTEIVWVFDDVLDLSVAKQCRLRMMIARTSNPLFNDLVKRENLAEYFSFCSAADHGLREVSDLLIGLNGNYDEVILSRAAFADKYKEYLSKRNKAGTIFYTNIESAVAEQTPV